MAARRASVGAALQAWLQAQWARPRPGLGARLLQPLSWLYAGLAALHAGVYQLGLARVQRAPVPVLVVGNLVAGGGGKTPTVIALVQRLRALGFTPGVVSRGHGRQGDGVHLVQPSDAATVAGDEPLLITRRAQVPVAVGRDRAAACAALCAAHPAIDLLVLDDGLQHHRLQHDAVLLVLDARGIGNGLRLPAGPLRTPLPRTLPRHWRVLYTGGVVSTPLPGHIGQRRLAGLQPLGDWWAGAPLPADGGWAALQNRPVLAAAGLARPEPFFAMLRAQGLQIEPLALSDHHPMQPPPWPPDTADVVVTEKDAVKLPPGGTGASRVWVVPLDFQIEPGFDAALRSLCAPLRPPGRGAD